MPIISDIDKNFNIINKINKNNIVFYNIDQKPFEIYGVFRENDIYKRMPACEAKKVSNGVLNGSEHGAGGRVRFVTDSRYVALTAKMVYAGKMPHAPLLATAGFDMYCKQGDISVYIGAFVPPMEIEYGYSSVIDLPDNALREITINFPLFSPLKEVQIGLEDSAKILPPQKYMIEKPIVYYGSSITHGACASRPGNIYEAIISRRIDANFINLGFAGCAKGEIEMAEYISKLDMSAFIYDYDHNAPNPEHLQRTHKPMFDLIRGKHPNLPIVMISRPKLHLNAEEEERFAIIKSTYQAAVKAGDRNVYFLDGRTLVGGMIAETALVDHCHPNDSGFVGIAKKVGDILDKVLNNKVLKEV